MTDSVRSTEQYLTTKNFHAEEWHTAKGRILREVIFGCNDGLVTTLGFLAGVTGSIVQKDVILLAGLAEIVAGAFSMSTGAYISSKSQREFYEMEIRRERREIEEDPQHEMDEIRQIYAERGFSDEEIDILVKRITSDKDLWLRFMLREELGLGDEAFSNPVRIGAIMGFSFLIGSFFPLAPYFFFPPGTALVISSIVSLGFLFALGAWKTKITKMNWLKSGFEMLAVGTGCAAVGYAVGLFVSNLTGK
jgi:predicted membrane protein (TIGR00267 family)